MKLSEARTIAEHLLKELVVQEVVETASIGGSIRRCKEEVKDIEIVLVPKWEDGVNQFYLWQLDAGGHGWIDWIKPGCPEIVRGYPVNPHAKYQRAIHRYGLKIDFFIAQESNYGLIQTIRTGSNFFTQALMGHAKRIKRRVQGGYVTDEHGSAINTPNETDVFDVLKLNWIAPEHRSPSHLGAAYRMLEDAKL